MTNRQYYRISGYFKDDKTEFTDYLVSVGTDSIDEERDNQIFFYYSDYSELSQSIAIGEKTNEDFVVTNHIKEITHD
jgi:hypothetical protein